MRLFAPAAFAYQGASYPYGWINIEDANLAKVLQELLYLFPDMTSSVAGVVIDPVSAKIKKMVVGTQNVPTELAIAKSLVDIVHTGTTAETKIFSQLIPAGLIAAPAMLRMVSGLRFVTTATAGNRMVRIRLNTADSLSGATQLCANIMNTLSVTQGVIRTDEIIFDTPTTQKGSLVNAGWSSMQGNDWSSGALAVAADMYLILSCQLVDAADVFTLKSFVATLLNGD